MFTFLFPVKIVGVTYNHKMLKRALNAWFALKPRTRKLFDFIADSVDVAESGFDFFIREYLSLGHAPAASVDSAEPGLSSQAEKPAQESKEPPTD